MEAGGTKVLEAEQVKGTSRAQRGVKALREVYPEPGFLYITCKLCSYGIERYQQRCVTPSKKTQPCNLEFVIPANPRVASHVGRTRLRGIVLQHMAVKLVVPAIHEQVRAFAAFIMVAAWNIAALVTQPDVVVAVVLSTSEPARETIFRFVEGKTTQLGKSWYSVSY